MAAETGWWPTAGVCSISVYLSVCWVLIRCVHNVVVYDTGTLFDVAILDITDDDIRSRFLEVTLSLP